jgi:hypothetical protein
VECLFGRRPLDTAANFKFQVAVVGDVTARAKLLLRKNLGGNAPSFFNACPSQRLISAASPENLAGGLHRGADDKSGHVLAKIVRGLADKLFELFGRLQRDLRALVLFIDRLSVVSFAVFPSTI